MKVPKKAENVECDVSILDLQYNHEIVPSLIQTQIADNCFLSSSCWNLVDDYATPLCVQDTRHSLTLMALKQSDAGVGCGLWVRTKGYQWVAGMNEVVVVRTKGYQGSS